jgi:hypothetical protein
LVQLIDLFFENFYRRSTLALLHQAPMFRVLKARLLHKSGKSVQRSFHSSMICSNFAASFTTIPASAKYGSICNRKSATGNLYPFLVEPLSFHNQAALLHYVRLISRQSTHPCCTIPVQYHRSSFVNKLMNASGKNPSKSLQLVVCLGSVQFIAKTGKPYFAHHVC